MNALVPSAILAPTEIELEPHHYLSWKLELAQSWIQLSKVYYWKIIDDNNQCREKGSFNGDLADLCLEFRKKVDGYLLMGHLTKDWIFSPSKILTHEDFKDNPQAWRDRCRLSHLVRELEKMKQGNPNVNFQGAIETMINDAQKAINCLDKEVAQSPKIKGKPSKN